MTSSISDGAFVTRSFTFGTRVTRLSISENGAGIVGTPITYDICWNIPYIAYSIYAIASMRNIGRYYIACPMSFMILSAFSTMAGGMSGGVGTSLYSSSSEISDSPLLSDEIVVSIETRSPSTGMLPA